MKKLLSSLILGFFMTVAMTGCGDHGHSHDNGRSHKSANQEADKTNSNHNTID